MTEAEIQEYISAYASAARNAVHGAGFDGVEIHGANGYLVDQFLQTTSNTRADRWGGNEEGRTRFAREVVDAVVDAVGPERVGIRVSPWNPSQGEIFRLNLHDALTMHGFIDMGMSDPRLTFAYLASALRDKHPKLAYLHVIESRLDGSSGITSDRNENNDFLREIWSSGKGGQERTFISAGGYNRETALRAAEDKGGLIAFGRLYIPNVSDVCFAAGALC